MRRKVIRQGHNTMTLSLPIKWCKSHDLKEGDEVEVSEKGEFLILSKEAYKGTGSVSVDVTGLDRNTIILLIQSLYNYGYDLINITTKDTKAKWYWGDKDISMPTIINYAVNRLIGAEVVSSSSGKYKIQVVTEENREKFETVLRRIFLLMIELFDTFIERYRKLDVSMIESIEFVHLNLKKFMNYGERLLNKFGYEEADKTAYYFAIIMFLSRIDETLKNLSGPPEKPFKPSKKCCDMIQEIRDAFENYYKLFYKYDIGQVSELIKTRDLFKRRLYHSQYKNLNKDDIYLLGGLTQVFEVMLDLDELRMAIGY